MRKTVTKEPAKEAAYPREEERDVVLRSGSTLRLRPIRREDAPALLAFYRRLSPDSLYFRFFSLPNVDADRAAGFCRVDYDSQFALVGEAAGRIVAVAHYFRLPHHPDRAEVAFTVEDPLQGQGVGTRLLERLAEIARRHGIATFEAEVLGHNRRMIDVFRNCGFETTERRMEGSVERIVLDIAPTAAYEEHAADRSARAAFASMQRLFEPAVVAVVGASRERGKIGAEIFHNLQGVFQGTVVPINPRADEIKGARCYPRITDVPGPVDLAVIAVPSERVEAAIDDCAAKGVRRHRRDHRRFLGDRGRGPPPRGRPPRQGPRRRHADGRAQLHGPREHRSAVPPQRDVRPHLPAGGKGGPVLPERRAGPRAPRLRLEAQPRNLDLRLGREQGGRLGQRPDPVLGRGPEDRGDPPVPRELRQPGPLLEASPAASRAGSRSSPSSPAARARAPGPRRRTPERSPSRTRSSTRCCGRRASSGRERSRSSSTSPCSSPTSPSRAAAASRS